MSEFYRNYLAVAVFIGAALLMVGAMLGVGRLIRPSRPRREKLMPYEAGSDPVLGFGQMTFLFSLVGVALAAVLARRARHAQSTFIRTTVGLTLLSFVPDIAAQASSVTRLSLMVSHVIAAAIVIPRLAGRLSD